MNLLSQLHNAIQSGTSVSLVTLLTCPDCKAGNEGQMMLLYADGRVEGVLIDEPFTKYVIKKMEELTWKPPTLIDLSYEGKQDYKIFWDQPTIKNKAVIFGAGHISKFLVDALAMIDYEITVVDDRPDFANEQNFPKAERVVLKSFKQALEEICPHVDEHTAIIIVTRGHQYDLQCLRAAIKTKAGYLGMIGSKSRIKATIEFLSEEGVSEEMLRNIHAPIGLNIGAQTPAEVALSIAAEVVAAFYGKSGGPMSIVGGVRHGC